jgi:hypothetical protein
MRLRVERVIVKVHGGWIVVVAPWREQDPVRLVALAPGVCLYVRIRRP